MCEWPQLPAESALGARYCCAKLFNSVTAYGEHMRGVLLDLDGVFYVGDQPVPGGPDAVRWLNDNGIPYRFLTNTTSRPRAAVVSKLNSMGISASDEQVLTPAIVARDVLRSRDVRHPALFVPETTAGEFAELEPLPDDADTGAGAVVIGDLGDSWDFATLNRAFRLLMAESDPPLIALGTTRYWQAPDGLRLDAGAFVAALECASGKQALVLGKPDKEFYSRAVASLGIGADGDGERANVVMVGDDLRSDVEGAQRAGLSGVLVRTGKFTPADLESDVVPDAVLDSIADLAAWLNARDR